jgi:hypothetical protein
MTLTLMFEYFIYSAIIICLCDRLYSFIVTNQGITNNHRDVNPVKTRRIVSRGATEPQHTDPSANIVYSEKQITDELSTALAQTSPQPDYTNAIELEKRNVSSSEIQTTNINELPTN